MSDSANGEIENADVEKDEQKQENKIEEAAAEDKIIISGTTSTDLNHFHPFFVTRTDDGIAFYGEAGVYVSSADPVEHSHLIFAMWSGHEEVLLRTSSSLRQDGFGDHTHTAVIRMNDVMEKTFEEIASEEKTEEEEESKVIENGEKKEDPHKESKEEESSEEAKEESVEEKSEEDSKEEGKTESASEEKLYCLNSDGSISEYQMGDDEITLSREIFNEYALFPQDMLEHVIAFYTDSKSRVDEIASSLTSRFPGQNITLAVSNNAMWANGKKIFKFVGQYISPLTDIKYNGDPWAFSAVQEKNNSKECAKEKKPLSQSRMNGNIIKNINDLPDAAFAVIESGEKTKKEKIKDKIFTIPKNTRHLPHHTGAVLSGREHNTIDVARFRNALARHRQVKPVTNRSKKALIADGSAHLARHAKSLIHDSIILKADNLKIDILDLSIGYYIENNKE